MPYKIRFGQAVSADLLKIPKSAAAQIMKAVEQRLTVDPIGLGKPLRYELKGCRRLRVGDWRVIYTIDDETVTLLRIVLRRDAY